jgi:hypothetical protein
MSLLKQHELDRNVEMWEQVPEELLEQPAKRATRGAYVTTDAKEAQRWLCEREYARFGLVRGAVLLVLNGVCSPCVAAKAVGVNRGKVERAVAALRARREMMHDGRPRRLNAKDEAVLVEQALKAADAKKPAAATALAKTATAIVCTHTTHPVDVVPISPSTVKRAIRRHSDILTLSRPKSIAQQRLLTVAAVREWFAEYAKVYARHDRINTLVANFDETMATVSDKVKAKVVCRRSQPNWVTSIAQKDDHVTLGQFIFADGSCYEKIQVVLPLQTLPALPGVDVHAPPEELAGSLLNKYTWHGSARGWMTAEIFSDIIRRVFIPEVVRRRTGSNRRALLLIDGASSHDSQEVRDMLEEAGIDLVMLLPNSTHLLQPLDAGIFGPFKQHLHKNLSAMRSSLSTTRRRDFSTVPARRAALLQAAVDAMRSATGMIDIVDAFTRTGICPVDVEQPLKNPVLVETQDLAEQQQQQKLSRTGIPIADGHGVVSVGEIAELAQAEPKKKAKKFAGPVVVIDDDECAMDEGAAAAGTVVDAAGGGVDAPGVCEDHCDGTEAGAGAANKKKAPAASKGAGGKKVKVVASKKGKVGKAAAGVAAAAADEVDGDDEFKKFQRDTIEMRRRVAAVGAAQGLRM